MIRYQLKIVFLLVAIIIIAYGSRAQETACESLVWSDEFDADGAPSTAKWNYDTGGGGWGNNELQTYTNNRTNSWVENGLLHIKATKASGSWTSARLVTRAKGDWLYGRIEVKAKLPSRKGTWPAIWMLPTDWEYGGWPASGEIDIMEHVGYDPGVVHGTIHTEAYNHGIGTQKGASITVDDASSVFHVYAIEWTAEDIKWYVDDQLYFTFNNKNSTYKEWPFDKRFHLLLNIAIGGDWGGAQGIDPNLTEAVMEVDYVRVYNDKMAQPVVQGPTINAAGDEPTYSVGTVQGAQYKWHFPEGVVVISGEGTNSASVRWNDSPGDIQVEVFTSCDTVVSDIFHVNYLNKPDSDQLEISTLNEDQELLWGATPGSDNTVDLSGEDGNLSVAFQISKPSQNPSVYYDFDGLFDLSEINQLAFDLKVDPANPPSNMRIDLVDTNGRVKLSNLFKIDSFELDDSFHTYNHLFTANADGSFRIDRVAQIRVYFNYGVFGRSGSGAFQLKNMRMQVPVNTAIEELISASEFKVFPVPASEFVTITSTSLIHEIQLYSLQGNLILSKSGINDKSYQLYLGQLTPGVYLLNINGQHIRRILLQ